MTTSLRTVMMNSLNVLKGFKFDSVLMKKVPAMLKKSLDIQIKCAEELVDNFADITLVQAAKVVAQMGTMISTLTDIRELLSTAFPYEEAQTPKTMNWGSLVVNTSVVH